MIKVMNKEHLNATEQSQTKIFKSLTAARAHAKKCLDAYEHVYLVRLYDSYFREKFLGYGVMMCREWHKTLA